ncbi:DUF5134 domain-containing protein [Streptomyces sp. WMMC897]|uniref:DUF5134 domain-containing protein n=1 Tax=Streptomyces sp. WMMC897 TaxID=3014782 RepID=UPI0022B64433|nr:DUF5134 domain-containing protein [Streptomyces sp. WMMC897]MCZ7415618.1 DUF5134 domain-containing protein [Streptomyces sp. WMMC897]
MHVPAQVGWLLAGVCALAGALCLVRARQAARGGAREAGRRPAEAAAAEAVMGFAMALMAIPGGVLPDAAHVAVFGALALWALALGLRGVPHQFHHLVEAAAMAWLMLPLGAGHGGGPPAVTGALLVYFCARAVLGGVRLLPAAGPPGSGTAEVAEACRLMLTVAMCAMVLG